MVKVNMQNSNIIHPAIGRGGLDPIKLLQSPSLTPEP